MGAHLTPQRASRRRSHEADRVLQQLQELSEADFDLSLTGFDPGEIDALLVDPEDEERANAAPSLILVS